MSVKRALTVQCFSDIVIFQYVPLAFISFKQSIKTLFVEQDTSETHKQTNDTDKHVISQASYKLLEADTALLQVALCRLHRASPLILRKLR